MKKIASVILTGCLLLSTRPVEAVSFNVSSEESSLQSTPPPTIEIQETENQVQTYSSIVADGYCGGEGDGTNLTWTLYNDGELEIRGTGRMEDYL